MGTGTAGRAGSSPPALTALSQRSASRRRANDSVCSLHSRSSVPRMQLLNSRVKSEGNYGRKGHGGDSGADVPFLRTHAGGRSPRGLGRCKRLSSRHHTLNTTARGCLYPRPACALTGDMLSKAARPGRSTGSIHGVPQRSPTTESSLLA